MCDRQMGNNYDNIFSRNQVGLQFGKARIIKNCKAIKETLRLLLNWFQKLKSYARVEKMLLLVDEGLKQKSQ